MGERDQLASQRVAGSAIGALPEPDLVHAILQLDELVDELSDVHRERVADAGRRGSGGCHRYLPIGASRPFAWPTAVVGMTTMPPALRRCQNGDTDRWYVRTRGFRQLTWRVPREHDRSRDRRA